MTADRGSEAGALVRSHAAEIVARWRDGMPTELVLGDGAGDLVSVVLSVATAAERPHLVDGVQRGAAETLLAGGADLAHVLRHLGLLRRAIFDSLRLPEQDGSDALRRHLDAAVDALAEAAAAVATERLQEAAYADPLTRLPNRRAMERDLAREIARADRRGAGVTVVVGDLDGLKQINDGEGHAAGDRALQALAGALLGALRAEDSAYRIGGDEFVVLLPEASATEAAAVMARARAAGAPRFSWGAGTFPVDGVDAASLLEAADHRLLQSRSGRSPSGPPVPDRPLASLRRATRARRALRVTGAIVLGALVGGSGVGAAAGTLPAPVQQAVHVALERISIHVPPAGGASRRPAPDTGGHLDRGDRAGDGAPAGAGATPPPAGARGAGPASGADGDEGGVRGDDEGLDGAGRDGAPHPDRRRADDDGSEGGRGSTGPAERVGRDGDRGGNRRNGAANEGDGPNGPGAGGGRSVDAPRPGPGPERRQGEVGQRDAPPAQGSPDGGAGEARSTTPPPSRDTEASTPRDAGSGDTRRGEPGANPTVRPAAG